MTSGLRERKKLATRQALHEAALRLVAEHGLASVSIDDIAERADVSPRTFFNYFASKDDAVLGIPLERSDAAAIARFLTGGSGGPGISANLLTDLALLAEERWRALDIAPDTVQDLFRAVEKEPRLLARMLELGFEGEQFDARLIEQRENLLSGDLRAQVAAQVVGALVRSAAGEFLKPGNAESFTRIFERRIGAARDLFATQTAVMGTPE